jgi:DNA-binding response OmpR family regulator
LHEKKFVNELIEKVFVWGGITGNALECQKIEQSKYTILVVEDNSPLLDVIYEILESQDFRVTTATSGEEAIETLNTKGFDLVITDINLGKVNGMAVLKKAKEIRSETMAIIMTGSLDADYATEAMQLGANDYLFKPFGLNDFLERVSKCLEKLESMRGSKRSTMGNSASNDHTLNVSEIASYEARKSSVIKQGSINWSKVFSEKCKKGGVRAKQQKQGYFTEKIFFRGRKVSSKGAKDRLWRRDSLRYKGKTFPCYKKQKGSCVWCLA